MRRNPVPPFSRQSLTLAIGAMVGGAFLPGALEAHPTGEEFLVNTTTDDAQENPDVAMDAEGNFVVVFENHIASMGNANVSAQRYNAAGEPQGSEFLVNTTANSGNTDPVVAMDADGDFVVVWMDFGDDGSGYGVYGQRYNAAGVAQGSNFLVNTTTANAQRRPEVDMDPDGDFVVVWEDDQFDANGRSVKAQRYNAAGVAQGGQMDVSTDGAVDQVFPKVAMDDEGNFVVGWAAGNVGANQDVVFRLYNSSGVAQTAVTQVNVGNKMDHASGTVNNMSVGMDDRGRFTIAWHADNLSPATSLGILARRYASNGSPQGAAFEVSVVTATDAPEVVTNGAGEIAIVYEAPDGSLAGPTLQRFYINGQPLGPAFHLNDTIPLGQTRPAVALDENGNGVVVWEAANNQDGDNDGVYARLVTGAGIAPQADFDADVRGDVLFRDPQTGRNHIWLMDDTIKNRGNTHRYPTQWQLGGAGDVDRDGMADLVWRNVQNGALRIWRMDGRERVEDVKVGGRPLTWHVAGVGDFNRDSQADVLWRQDNGQLVLWILDEFSLKVTGQIVPPVADEWVIVGIDDFDGNGTADILFRNSQNGFNGIWFMNGAQRTPRGIPNLTNLNFSVVGTGDLNRDGRADIVWRNQNTGVTLLWLMDGADRIGQRQYASPDGTWTVIGVRDVNDDGFADILFQENTRRVRRWLMSGLDRVSDDILGTPAPGLVPVDLE